MFKFGHKEDYSLLNNKNLVICCLIISIVLALSPLHIKNINIFCKLQGVLTNTMELNLTLITCVSSFLLYFILNNKKKYLKQFIIISIIICWLITISYGIFLFIKADIRQEYNFCIVSSKIIFYTDSGVILFFSCINIIILSISLFFIIKAKKIQEQQFIETKELLTSLENIDYSPFIKKVSILIAIQVFIFIRFIYIFGYDLGKNEYFFLVCIDVALSIILPVAVPLAYIVDQEFLLSCKKLLCCKNKNNDSRNKEFLVENMYSSANDDI